MIPFPLTGSPSEFVHESVTGESLMTMQVRLKTSPATALSEDFSIAILWLKSNKVMQEQLSICT